ncbi:MAG: aspartate--tRNA ligase [Acidimicrobiia bacterium]|nr:aspartate--tRNA ligase [Acidimicrobiia bacterium]MDH4306353.1 aspartate--tRNA ligase [Acidimicrobiia bacterium]MDH5292254.1 aspartate--tRNA ligase [Acidimicrobiia bacterium]
MKTIYRTAHAADVTSIGETVAVAGWVQARRDHGGVIFIDLRDSSGLLQVVLDPAVLGEAKDLRMEFCVMVSGEVRARPEGTVNPNLATGGVELGATALTVLSTSAVLPFQIEDRVDVDERARLKYRYLDLRRPKMAANLKARSRAIAVMRRVMDDLGFLEVETPTLIASTPEGARDLLVPSRHQKGSFYALPQSPQLFKQLLMVAGVERYYQVAKCYRDEDFRSDRQVEFAQLDFEGAFWDRDDVLETLEEVTSAVTREVRGVELSRPFPRLTWQEAMDRFGSDKPDTRFGMEIVDLSETFAGTGFRAFGASLEEGGTVRGINAGAIESTRSRMDALTERAKELGAKGLVWMVVEDDATLRSPVAKFLSGDEMEGLKVALGATPGDVLLMAADAEWRTVAGVLGGLRLDLGKPGSHDELAPLFVIDFPTFEPTGDGGWAASHHPFTAPVDVDQMANDPANSISRAYDLVLNGSELGSGSVRIFDPVAQAKVFEVLGISKEQAESRFGWFLEGLRYGTPPHAGFAIGIDRFVAILQDEPNIRQIIPFPKTQTGSDPLTGSPTPVEETQLAELGIRVRPDAKPEA